MGRRAAGGARVVPAATITAFSCSSSSAEVLTPVVPVDHVAQSGAKQCKGEVPLLYLVESGAASSKCYQDDGEEEVSQLPSPMRSDVKNGMLPFGLGMTVEVVVDDAPHRVGHTTPQPNESVLASREGGTSAESEDSQLPHLPHLPHLPLQQNSAAFAGTPFLATELSLARTSRFRRWRLDGRQSRRFLQVNRSMGSTIGPTSSAPPSPRRTASLLSAQLRRRRLQRADSSATSLGRSSGRPCRGGRCRPRATLRTSRATRTRGVSARRS
jgi:hypothetical protein